MFTFALVVPVIAAADGKSLYKTRCASCHGLDGSGQTPIGKPLKVHDLRTDEVQKQTDAELAKVIIDGKGKMPAFKSTSASDVEALIAHIRSLKE